jgi:predicted Zn-dependent protease
MKTRIWISATLVTAVFCAACARVEGTDRRQLLLTSTAQALIAFVERVGKRLAAAAPDKDFNYEFTVIESPAANAFCLPGGKVAVYTGILPYCQNEAGLAAVLGHEIGHAIARHGGERMSQGQIQEVGGVTLAALLEAKGVSPTTGNLAMTAFGIGSQVGVMLPFSRSHETEADYLGLIYMAKAGYDPHEAVAFWNRFAALGSGTPTFLSTHPSSPDRAKALEVKMPEADAIYAASGKHGTGEPVPDRWRTMPVK